MHRGHSWFGISKFGGFVGVQCHLFGLPDVDSLLNRDLGCDVCCAALLPECKGWL